MLYTILQVFIYFGVTAQYDPHPDTIHYREPYRGQFHFSPKTEWMNDINGLVYQGGLYHMIYQWGKSIRHGGYATSPDLLHWTDRGVALIPQKSFLPPEAVRNVTGDQVFSGSAVVVRGETARRITGSDREAIIAIYTGTAAGTCLVWSNDTGRSWHNYPGNPVANSTPDAYPRDPCVIWHAPTQKWVMALYENGTTFYGSTDLIRWDSLSNVAFGYECPDIYELPADGNPKEMKWVLQDANGSYLVGKFNGTHFIKDPGQDTLIMDVGPDFYAAQTFPAGNLPNHDPRIIQIAWMDHWNGGIGEHPWERNATFPVHLGLITHKGMKRITRIPIREIESLYASTISWQDQPVDSVNNLLAPVRSKTFNLTAEFDLSRASADSLWFQVANKTITYDIRRKMLLGHLLEPDNEGHVVIRMLVDWGQLEVFGNGGIFSYTQQFPFTPSRDDITLLSNGKVWLVTMTFHEIQRTWPSVQD